MFKKPWFTRSFCAPTRAPQPARRVGLGVERLEVRDTPSAAFSGNISGATLAIDVRDNYAPTGATLVASSERQAVLAQNLAVDYFNPGNPNTAVGIVGGDVAATYGAGGPSLNVGTVPAGTLVQSDLIRFDPPTAGTSATGTITYSGQTIIGLIYRSATLDASDSVVGASGVTYPSAGSEPGRGLESDSQQTGGNFDAIFVNSPHQITFALRAGAAQDHIRVLTTFDPPQLLGQTFSVSEAASTGATVGAVVGTPSQSGDALTYAITAGNTSGTYAIEPATGRLVIANAGALDFETHPQTLLQVSVTDQRGHSATGLVIVNVQNAAPSQPIDVDSLANCPFVTVSNGEPVGLTASATDPHGGAVSYSLTDSAGGRFAISSQTGVVTVANSALLQGNTDYTLTARADDGHGGVSTTTFHVFAVSLPSATPAALTAQANAFYAAGNFREANYLYGVVVEMTPTDASAYERRGNALVALGQLNDAVYAYTVAVGLAPTNDAFWGKLGSTQIANGQLSAGIYSLNRAVGLAPTNAVYRLQLGEAQYLNGQRDDARYQFTWAMVYDPSLSGYIHSLYGDLF